jgi:hypothetical protein
MKFGNLFYHGTSVGVGSHNPTPSHPMSLKFSKRGRGPAKVGPYSIPKKRTSGWSDYLFSPFPHFPILPTPHHPQTLKAHGNMLSSPLSPLRWKHMESCFLPPFPSYAESTWKHAFYKDLLHGFVNIFWKAGVGSAELQSQRMFSVSPVCNLETIQRLWGELSFFVKEGAT